MTVSLVPGVRAAAPPAPAQPRQTLNQADFLSLMTAQLKNQDPTKPVDNSEYVAQMAQFSTVSGITESNSKLADIAAKLDRLITLSTPATPAPATPAQD